MMSQTDKFGVGRTCAYVFVGIEIQTPLRERRCMPVGSGCDSAGMGAPVALLIVTPPTKNSNPTNFSLLACPRRGSVNLWRAFDKPSPKGLWKGRGSNERKGPADKREQGVRSVFR